MHGFKVQSFTVVMCMLQQQMHFRVTFRAPRLVVQGVGVMGWVAKRVIASPEYTE